MSQRSHAFDIDDDEAPTTPRQSSIVLARPVARSAPPRPPIRSLASILEPEEVEPPRFVPSRLALVPPDPDSFGIQPAPAPSKAPRDSMRWLVRIALMIVVLAEELLLAAPAGALHRPRDAADAASMLRGALYVSAVAAVE